jgi:hypothetical protein
MRPDPPDLIADSGLRDRPDPVGKCPNRTTGRCLAPIVRSSRAPTDRLVALRIQSANLEM